MTFTKVQIPLVNLEALGDLLPWEVLIINNRLLAEVITLSYRRKFKIVPRSWLATLSWQVLENPDREVSMYSTLLLFVQQGFQFIVNCDKISSIGLFFIGINNSLCASCHLVFRSERGECLTWFSEFFKELSIPLPQLLHKVLEFCHGNQFGGHDVIFKNLRVSIL